MKRLGRYVLIALLTLSPWTAAHESPVDHVGRELRIWWADGRLHVGYRLLLAERAALLQLHAMDSNGDGKISDDERAKFFSNFSNDLAGRFLITIDGKKFPLHPDGDVRLDPQLGQSFTFIADEIPLAAGKHAGELIDEYSRSYPGPYRLLNSGTASGSELIISETPETKEGHPGIVTLRFDVTIPAARP